MQPLDGAYQRVKRASEHLTDLESRIHIATDNEKNRLASQFNPYSDNLRQRTFSTIKYTPPKRWGILIGEIAYNLRSALDYLIHELSAIKTGIPNTGSQFPVEKSKECFLSRKRTYLKGLSIKHITAIEDLQPYKGITWIKHLSTLCNHDKHRLLTPIVNVSESIVETGSINQFEGLPGYIHSAKNPSGKSEMHVYADLSLHVTFSDGLPVIETLQKYILQVSDVLDSFNSEFK